MSKSAQRYSRTKTGDRSRAQRLHEVDPRRFVAPSRPSKVRRTSGERRTRQDSEIAAGKARKSIIWAWRHRFTNSTIYAENEKDLVGQIFLVVRHPRRLITEVVQRMLDDKEIEATEYSFKLKSGVA